MTKKLFRIKNDGFNEYCVSDRLKKKSKQWRS